MNERGGTDQGTRRLGRLLSVSLLAVLLSGCSDLGLFADTKTADDGTYPNLGTVPARPAARSDAGARQEARDGLVADRANARYSSDPIRRPYPEGAVGALPPDGNFPVASTFRPTEPPPGSAPVPVSAPVSGQRVGEVQPSSQGLPPVPAPEPRQPLPDAPPPAPVDLVPQPAPMSLTTGAAPAATVPPPPAVPLPLASGAEIDARLDALLADARRDSMAPLVIGGVPEGPSLATLYFRDGSAHLDAAALTVLKQVAQIQKARGQRLVLVGHASRRAETNDPVKRETFNQEISAARAENTRKALQRLGVKAPMLVVRAAGDQAAVFDEAAPAGEAANRRVEIYLEE